DLESNIFGVNGQGIVVEEYEIEDPLDIFGLATYPDDPDGMTIYAFCLSGDYDTRIMKMDPESGIWELVIDLESEDSEKAGGACIFRHWDNFSMVFAGITRGDDDIPDMLKIWQIQAHTGWLTFDEEPFGMEPDTELNFPLLLNAAGYMFGTEIHAGIRFTHNGRGDDLLVPVTMRVSLDVDDQMEDALLPEQIELTPPYPNPFNNQAQLSFRLPAAASVSIEMYTIEGRRMATLYKGLADARRHQVSLVADNLPPIVDIPSTG
ncbi:hypothetical protein ACFLQV_05190, partial [Calditrichota bacterium]